MRLAADAISVIFSHALVAEVKTIFEVFAARQLNRPNPRCQAQGGSASPKTTLDESPNAQISGGGAAVIYATR